MTCPHCDWTCDAAGLARGCVGHMCGGERFTPNGRESVAGDVDDMFGPELEPAGFLERDEPPADLEAGP